MQYRDVLNHAVVLTRRFLKRFSLSSLVMFGLALVSELPVLFVRVFTITLTIGIIETLNGDSSYGPKWMWVGTIPTLWAMFALITPIGSGWWWKQRSGGRAPSAREQLVYHDAIEQLQSNNHQPLPLPRTWFVIDAPLPDAAVCGETLMLSRGLLESEHLTAVIAHELGHLATPDGRITAALNRLVIAKPQHTATELLLAQHEHREHSREHSGSERPSRFGDETIHTFLQVARFTLWLLLFARGGLGLRLTRPIWGHYWRAREYTADNYAANLGQADELADFLEAHALIHDHPIPYIWLTEDTHPPTELRIDKLRDTRVRTPASPDSPVQIHG